MNIRVKKKAVVQMSWAICTILLLVPVTIRAANPPPRVFSISSGDAAGLTSAQLNQVHSVERQLSSRGRLYLKYAFVGPRASFTLFVSANGVPTDYDVDSIVLNDCHSSPHCAHLCGTRLEYSANALIPLGPSGYSCVQAWYWR